VEQRKTDILFVDKTLVVSSPYNDRHCLSRAQYCVHQILGE